MSRRHPDNKTLLKRHGLPTSDTLGHDDIAGRNQASADGMELRIRMLLRNGIVSKSGLTLADTEVLKEIAKRLGYSIKELKELEL